MKPRHQVSRAALELIESFEGYRRKAARLPDGRWTIGYGHTKTARDGAEVSPEDAEALLIYDLIEVAAAVNEWTFAPLTANQFDALCAFALNIGIENFRTSQVLRKINEGAFLQAACSMDMWRKAEFEGEKIVVDALVRRRAAEKALFLSAPGVHAPTPILPPQIDYEASNLVPRREPVDVRADLEGDQATAERVSPATASSAEFAVAPVVPAPPPTPPAAADTSAPPWPVFRPEGAAPARPTPPQAPSEPAWDIPSEPEWAPPPEPELPSPPADDPANLDLPSPPPPVQDGVLTLTPPPETPSVETPRPFIDEDERPTAANESEPEPELFAADQPAVAEHATSEFARRVVRPGTVIDDLAPFPDAEDTVIKSGLPPMVVWFLGLGVVGLAVFAGGIFFGVHVTKGATRFVGIGLGALGIVCVAAAVYFLLERLGGREE